MKEERAVPGGNGHGSAGVCAAVFLDLRFSPEDHGSLAVPEVRGLHCTEAFVNSLLIVLFGVNNPGEIVTVLGLNRMELSIPSIVLQLPSGLLV